MTIKMTMMIKFSLGLLELGYLKVSTSGLLTPLLTFSVPEVILALVHVGTEPTPSVS